MRRWVALSFALLTVVVTGLLGVVPALSQLGDALSPAQGQASVVAHGIAPMPEGQLGWRVTRAATPRQGEQPPRENPGFLLAESGALVLNHLDTDTWTRLAPGEAAFLPATTQHGEGSGAAAGPISFFRIDLVDASEVSIAGADELLFVGEPFASPGGNRDIDLVRTVLDPAETLALDIVSDAAPTLFLVTSGTVDLVPASNDAAAPVPLAAGQAAALSGDVIVSAADTATFVTAVIGPDVPLTLAQTASPTPTPLPEPASLSVQILACPVGYEGTDYAVDCVEPVSDVTLDLSSATGAFAQGTTGGDGTIGFVELIPDNYSLTGGVPGEFSQQVVGCANSAGPVETGASEALAAGATFAVEAGDAVACQWYVIPEDLQGEVQGTIAVAAYVCPGTPSDPAVDCTAIDATGAAVIGPDAAAIDPATGVPFGTYVLQTDGLAAPDGYELSEVRGSGGASDVGWLVTIDEANPNAALAVIFVPSGPTTGDGDEDTDGLSGAQETELGTDPVNPDTDGDGLFDGPEVAAGTDPTLFDTDGDGFGDNREAVAGADPLDPASVPEGDSGADTDGDLLSDTQEEELGTNAAIPDTDGDGLTDFAEVGFEPGSATGTDPLLFDTDGDGVGDGDEVASGTDPLDPGSG